PTNHLDLPARESLEQALKAFDGTVIFVSHDRYFISAVAQSVVELENRTITRYAGGYEGYRAQKQAYAAALAERKAEKEREEYKRERESSYRSKKDRAEDARLKAELKAIEADISARELREEELNSSLCDPKIACDYEKTRQITEEIQKNRTELDALYERYGQLLD
ncbi:MAG: hypothetical protein K2N47_05675, partial [Clostridia bacterium]|nr:hypothetical protein [Clostridia bacterium]